MICTQKNLLLDTFGHIFVIFRPKNQNITTVYFLLITTCFSFSDQEKLANNYLLKQLPVTDKAQIVKRKSSKLYTYDEYLFMKIYCYSASIVVKKMSEYSSNS